MDQTLELRELIARLAVLFVCVLFPREPSSSTNRFASIARYTTIWTNLALIAANNRWIGCRWRFLPRESENSTIKTTQAHTKYTPLS
jgi:hypothetical protein